MQIICAVAFIGNEPFAGLLGEDVVYNDEYPCLKYLFYVYDKTVDSALSYLFHRKGLLLNSIVFGKATENPNIYIVYGIIDSEIFEIFENKAANKVGEIQLTDAIKFLAKQENMTAISPQACCYDESDEQVFLEATVEYALRR